MTPVLFVLFGPLRPGFSAEVEFLPKVRTILPAPKPMQGGTIAMEATEFSTRRERDAGSF
jgi:hypothetical protein